MIRVLTSAPFSVIVGEHRACSDARQRFFSHTLARMADPPRLDSGSLSQPASGARLSINMHFLIGQSSSGKFLSCFRRLLFYCFFSSLRTLLNRGNSGNRDPRPGKRAPGDDGLQDVMA